METLSILPNGSYITAELQTRLYGNKILFLTGKLTTLSQIPSNEAMLLQIDRTDLRIDSNSTVLFYLIGSDGSFNQCQCILNDNNKLKVKTAYSTKNIPANIELAVNIIMSVTKV